MKIAFTRHNEWLIAAEGAAENYVIRDLLVGKPLVVKPDGGYEVIHGQYVLSVNEAQQEELDSLRKMLATLDHLLMKGMTEEQFVSTFQEMLLQHEKDHGPVNLVERIT